MATNRNNVNPNEQHPPRLGFAKLLFIVILAVTFWLLARTMVQPPFLQWRPTQSAYNFRTTRVEQNIVKHRWYSLNDAELAFASTTCEQTSSRLSELLKRVVRICCGWFNA